MTNGQIIIVNGTSGAGKTTTITNFGKRYDDCYLMMGIDQLMGSMLPVKFSMHGERSREGMYVEPKDSSDPDGPIQANFGDVSWQAFAAFHDMIAAASRTGQNIIVDHIMFLDPPILQDCIWRLEGLPVLYVSLEPPKDVLFKRLAERTVELPEQFADELGGDAEAREKIAEGMQKMTEWFYGAAYENDCYDLVIDTTKNNPDEVCELIEKRLTEGPGTAFETLRKRHPKK